MSGRAFLRDRFLRPWRGVCPGPQHFIRNSLQCVFIKTTRFLLLTWWIAGRWEMYGTDFATKPQTGACLLRGMGDKRTVCDGPLYTQSGDCNPTQRPASRSGQGPEASPAGAVHLRTRSAHATTVGMSVPFRTCGLQLVGSVVVNFRARSRTPFPHSAA
jgi:hypothetical protein